MTAEKHPHSEMTQEGRIANLQYRCNVANRVRGKSVFISIHANAFSKPSANGYGIHIFDRKGERFEIAKSIHQAAIEVLGVKTEFRSRGIKESAFYVNKYTDMPSILIEHLFFTNPREVKKLKDNIFRQKCAIHIMQGLIRYYQL